MYKNRQSIFEMKKILYIMHIPWGWIKQRPQFIAEGLSENYSVDVLYRKSFTNHCDNKSLINLISIPRLPLERIGIVKYLNKLIQKKFVKSIISKYDIVWTTYPNEIAIAALQYLKPHQHLIYDCMDDAIEFPNNKLSKRQVEASEKQIYIRSNAIFCSSSYLKAKIQKRYGMKEIKVINNALDSYTISDNRENSTMFTKSSNKRIVYIGTISEWINFDLVNRLAHIPNVDFYFIGPYKEGTEKLAKSKNIYFIGPVEHNQINQIMAQSDILIMPFILNELILSVNPVKLYEYIASGKPCFAPLYGESLPFEEYCYLYKNDDECIKLIEDVISNDRNAKKSLQECIEFAQKNTWEQRMTDINKIISSLEKK